MDKKNAFLIVRVTQAFKNRLLRLASRSNETLSEYLRRKLSRSVKDD